MQCIGVGEGVIEGIPPPCMTPTPDTFIQGFALYEVMLPHSAIQGDYHGS